MRHYPYLLDKIDLSKSEWVKSLFQRMGLTHRKATSSNLKIPAGSREETELLFMIQ